jgi:O-acetyl-ADP-ribose deacetylase
MPIMIDRVDITHLRVDAVVNAANESLLGGGGVDGAIHRAAGYQLLDYCKGLGGCRTGDAKITPGFNLMAKHVIHAVGPVWRGGNANEAKELESAYQAAFRLARLNYCASIALPAISCGAYGFPVDLAAPIALKVASTQVWCERIIFACLEGDVFRAFLAAQAALP